MENNILILLLETTIFSAVIYCAIMLFKKVFGQKMSPYLQCAVWWLLILRLVLPVTLDAGFRLIQIDNPTSVTAPSRQTEGHIPATTALNANATPATVEPTAQNVSGGRIIFNDTKPQAAGITWQQCITAVWISGAITTGIMLALSGLGLKKRLNSAAVQTPAYVRRAFTACRRQLNICKRLRVLTVSDINTPALTLSITPEIIIPESMAKRENESEIYFALVHELTHYKRRDHLCCLLIQVLKAVYWFNPFIRLAEKEIRMDMECACDAQVVSRMKPDAVSDYAKTLIKLSMNTRINCALGMALGPAFKDIEKRIKCIYMIKKSKTGAKCAAIFTALFIGVSCFTTACVPVQKEAAPTSTHTQATRQILDAQANSQSVSVAGIDIPKTVAPTQTPGQLNVPASNGPAANEILPPVVTESAIWREDNRLKFVFAVYNPNKNYAVEAPTVNIRAYDKNGEVISDEFVSGRYILPESYWYCAEASSEEVAQEPAESEFTVIANPDVAYVTLDKITDKAPDVKIEIDTADNTGIYGRGVYPQADDTQPVNVIALYRDNNGVLKGAYRLTLNSLSEDGVTAPIKIIYDGDEKYVTDNVEFHVQPWS